MGSQESLFGALHDAAPLTCCVPCKQLNTFFAYYAWPLRIALVDGPHGWPLWMALMNGLYEQPLWLALMAGPHGPLRRALMDGLYD